MVALILKIFGIDYKTINKEEKIISNLGITRNNNTGNLIIRFIVEKPSNFNEEQLKILNEIL